jgi:hypothetical protein
MRFSKVRLIREIWQTEKIIDHMLSVGFQFRCREEFACCENIKTFNSIYQGSHKYDRSATQHMTIPKRRSCRREAIGDPGLAGRDVDS